MKLFLRAASKKFKQKFKTNLDGKTIEQAQVEKRMKEDNKPGAIKHLYIISSYSGQTILYSTVKGKVTSSGKRLSPSTAKENEIGAFRIPISSSQYTYTNEFLGDDGTYGNSVEYLYWWDSKDIYHQQYVTGGMILHVSSQPMAVKSVTINLETSKSE